ncbi:MAG: type II toxin-antitoxin system RelB/DinJ family antitoxin [Ruminococcaceae bacterium]|nr:type II toxin-antitoxin system RelB/DinJ family antitoxin [Oscillospiraceae bacterium]
MAQTSINIRIDEDLKREFDNFCSDVGMSMTTAFCLFAKTVVRRHSIPFEITNLDENGFTPAEAAELKSRVEDMKLEKGKEHKLIDI